MIGADQLPDVFAGFADDERRAREATEAWVAAAMDADLYREVAGRLAGHLQAIAAAGDTAARASTFDARRGVVVAGVDAWRAYRKATVAAGIDLDRIERALDNRPADRAERTTHHGHCTTKR